MYSDEEDVFLFWNGRKEDVTNVALPFHHIEHIDEPRKEGFDGFSGTLFDTKGRQKQGWHNKLIWGDNKLILSSLANGALRDEIEKEGGLKLVYIDPPFAVGADFSHTIDINGESATKSQSVLEEIAYRDTWQKGISSYLTMMYERLNLMHNLLTDDGSFYLHADYRVINYLRIILDDIFGSNNYLNEIIWAYAEREISKNKYNRKHDNILFYAKNAKQNYTFNYDDVREEYSGVTLKKFKYTDENGRKYRLRYNDGRSDPPAESENTYRQYLDESGPLARDWVVMPILNQAANERLNYPTQKPEKLLTRIIKASSNEGDLIADFFIGSETTAAVAEKLNRKWIATDLGRFSIHTTRKRMIDVQRELKEAGQDFRAFEVLNLGKYERQFFIDDLQNGRRKQKQEVYLDLICRAYSAQRADGYSTLHAKKAGRMVHIGALDMPVTQNRVQDVFDECKKKLITQVDVLGFEFEMGLQPRINQEYKEQGVDIRLRYIPKDVFDPRAVEKGQVKFYDVSYLQAQAHTTGSKIKIELTNFVTNYTQDDLEEVQEKMRKGNKVVIENGQIIKISKDKNGIINREVLTQNWHDWVDYWSVDFDYNSKKEIIRITKDDGTVEEQWSGNYIFENEWQSFRTKQDRTLEFTSAEHSYPKKGKYRVMVKVVDILGIDTSQIIEVKI